MLWVDADVVTLDDLVSVDPEIPEIAKAERLLLEGNTGLLRRAQESAQTHLAQFMSISDLRSSDLSLRTFNIPGFISDRNTRYAGFAQLLVTGETADHWSPLKQWAVDRSLASVYRAAVNRNADRYQDRFDAVQSRILQESWPKLRRYGLPFVLNPLPCPGAVMERAGTFGPSNVVLVAGSGTALDEVDVAITWVAADAESYRSATVPATLVSGQVLRVSITGLIPPDGSQPLHTQASSSYSTKVATGYNVYVGKRFSKLYKQNSSPVSLLASYTLPGNPTYSGTELGLGQNADLNLTITSNLQRC